MTPPNAHHMRDDLFWIVVSAFLYLLILCLLISATGCGKQPTEVAPVPVKVTVLTPEEIAVSSRFSRSVEPLQSSGTTAGTRRRGYRHSQSASPCATRIRSIIVRG